MENSKIREIEICFRFLLKSNQNEDSIKPIIFPTQHYPFPTTLGYKNYQNLHKETFLLLKVEMMMNGHFVKVCRISALISGLRRETTPIR
jgi:hypothetical protein